MVRILLIALLVSLQMPQAIAGTVVLCVCERGSWCINSRDTCHCGGELMDGHACCGTDSIDPATTCDDLPAVSSNGSLCQHVSLFAGDAVKCLMDHGPFDLITCEVSSEATCETLSLLQSHGVGSRAGERSHPADLGSTVLRC